ncbi:hypothetical protein Hanom_Chr12g01116281 [Helianthus anomalus]
MHPNMFAYAQILGMAGSKPFFQGPQAFASMGGSQPSTQDTEPEIETVPEKESRQMKKDIEFLSIPIDHLVGDALILAQMR